jgi:PIN domain nuclease of toxin-antitoxin system
MILLDTHIWIWWVQEEHKLSAAAYAAIQEQETLGIGVSVFSCWEVAKLVELKRLNLPCSVLAWFNQALAYPGIRLLPLTPEIVVTSTELQNFHRDPADQIIVATAKVYGCPLVTVDTKIVGYSEIETIS